MILPLLILAAEPSALGDPIEDACYERDQSQQGMNRCAGEAYERADEALNAQWKKVMAVYGDDPETKAILLDSQRSWLKYRDSQCRLTAHDSLGGSIYSLILSGCLADLTRKRTQQLVDLTRPEGQ